jgi:HK97 family phage major capsid protein
MSLQKIKALREERFKLVTDAQAILKKETMTPADEQKFDALMLEVDAKKAEIDRRERALAAEHELGSRVEQRAGRDGLSIADAKDQAEKESGIFKKWLLGGMQDLSDTERAFMQCRSAPVIQAAQGVGTTTAGGFLVPQSFSDRLEVALKFYSGMMENAEIIETDSGAPIPWPTVNDTTQVGALLAENTTLGAQDVTFSSVTLNAFMYTSKLIAVSLQLMQDSFLNVDNLVADLAGQRLGRIWNTDFTVGAGTTLPKGIVVAAASGKVGIAGQTTSVIYDDLIDLIHSVDSAYRRGSKWMANDASIKVVRKLKDSQNRPLWEPSVQAGQPDTLLGYPVVTNNDVAVMAANAKSIVFGALNKYKVRRVRGVTLMRLTERYADNLQVGFFAFARVDGNLIDAGTNPVKYYANSAT